MKKILLYTGILFFFIACNDSNNSLATENEQLKKENDSLKNTPTAAETSPVQTPPPDTALQEKPRAGVHPISLQWISWDKKGEARLTPAEDGWYTISGSQTSEEKDYLNIDGKIRRVSEKELEFDGTIEVRVKYNNGGEPCVKKGKQRFFAKGSRKYFRLQNMENCAGGNLVDYVDIYPGSSSL